MPDPTRWRVTEARVIEGYALKASFVYEAGQILDAAVDPLDHIERLKAAGVLEPVEAEPGEDAS